MYGLLKAAGSLFPESNTDPIFIDHRSNTDPTMIQFWPVSDSIQMIRDKRIIWHWCNINLIEIQHWYDTGLTTLRYTSTLPTFSYSINELILSKLFFLSHSDAKQWCNGGMPKSNPILIQHCFLKQQSSSTDMMLHDRTRHKAQSYTLQPRIKNNARSMSQDSAA